VPILQPPELKIRVETELPAVVEEAVSYETGASRAQAADPELYVYEHHGKEFGWSDPGALTCFFEDVMLGRPMPIVFATKSIGDVDTLVAMTLFMHRDLALVPRLTSLVAAADLVHRRGAPAMAHVDIELANFFRFLRQYFHKVEGWRELSQRVKRSVAWIRDYVTEGNIPRWNEPPPTRIIDMGTQGFVVGESAAPLGDAWVGLFRQGFTRGVVFSPDVEGRRHVLATRKGPYVPFKLDIAAKALNEVERVLGELPEWKTDGMWLQSPPEGTVILVTDVLKVLVRT
jgi:hypothetical protein